MFSFSYQSFNSVDSITAKLRSAIVRLNELVVDNFLLVGFVVAVVLAFSVPIAGKLFYSFQTGNFRIVEFINNCVVFLISGLTLKIEDMVKVLKHKVALLYALLTINFITTLVAFCLVRLPFSTPAFAVGLAIFSTVPTTLGVGVALTQLARGDQVMSLLLTVVSNMLGIVTVPFLLHVYLNNGAVSIDPSQLAFKLTLTVFVPSVVGICCRRYIPWIPSFATKYKKVLNMVSTSNLAMIVWMALSTAHTELMKQNIGEIALVMVTAAIVHIFYLIYNRIVVSKYLLNISAPQAISVIIMSSQKSSPIALAVITNISTTGAQKGLMAIPCIIGQLLQIFIGSFVVKYLSKMVDDIPNEVLIGPSLTEMPNRNQAGVVPIEDEAVACNQEFVNTVDMD